MRAARRGCRRDLCLGTFDVNEQAMRVESCLDHLVGLNCDFLNVIEICAKDAQLERGQNLNPQHGFFTWEFPAQCWIQEVRYTHPY